MAYLDCLRCGNCCPPSCESFSRDKETGLATCLVHENKETEAALCLMSPNKLLMCGVACRAGIERVLKIDPSLEVETQVAPNGKIGFKWNSIPDAIVKKIFEERFE